MNNQAPAQQQGPAPAPAQQQGAAAYAPDPRDVQQKQTDIGQATGAPSGTLGSYETVSADQGVGTDVGNYKNL